MRTLAIMAAIVMGLATIGWGQAATATKKRTISTTGEAVVYVVPDEVQIGFGVETYDPNLDQAKAKNDQLSAQLLKAIKGMGIEDRHIQTNQLSLEIRYRDYSRVTSGIEAYVARRAYSVTLKDTKKAEALVDLALKNGANQLFGIEYRTTQLRKYRDQARSMAIKAAKEKAVALAGELDCKVGKPMTITEANMGYYTPWMYNNRAMAQNAMQNAGGGGEQGETIPMGQIGVRASVSVSFELQ